MVDYKKRLVEVDEILKYMSEVDLMKIPESIRIAISQTKDSNYMWKYDQTKGLNEQGLSKDTITILSYLNTEFMLDPEQKQLMEQMHEFNERKYRENLEKTTIAKESLKIENDTQKVELQKEEIENEEVTSLAVQTEELSFFKKFVNKIKNIFKKK